MLGSTSLAPNLPMPPLTLLLLLWQSTAVRTVAPTSWPSVPGLIGSPLIALTCCLHSSAAACCTLAQVGESSRVFCPSTLQSLPSCPSLGLKVLPQASPQPIWREQWLQKYHLELHSLPAFLTLSGVSCREGSLSGFSPLPGSLFQIISHHFALQSLFFPPTYSRQMQEPLI